MISHNDMSTHNTSLEQPHIIHAILMRLSTRSIFSCRLVSRAWLKEYSTIFIEYERAFTAATTAVIASRIAMIMDVYLGGNLIYRISKEADMGIILTKYMIGNGLIMYMSVDYYIAYRGSLLIPLPLEFEIPTKSDVLNRDHCGCMIII